MHTASANGYDDVVEYLLDHGARIDVVDSDCWQPIHAAACWGQVLHIDRYIYIYVQEWLIIKNIQKKTAVFSLLFRPLILSL